MVSRGMERVFGMAFRIGSGWVGRQSERGVEIVEETGTITNNHKRVQSGTPRGVFAGRPPVRIHALEDPATGKRD